MTPIEKRIREAVIQLWSTHHSFTQRDIAAATATSCEGPLPQRSVAYYFSRWEDSGILRTQTAANGNSGAARAFGWGAPSDATLRCVLNNALSTGALPEATQRHIRTAVRTVLQLPSRCEDDAILAASEQVPTSELYEFPERVLAAYKDRNPAESGSVSIYGPRCVSRSGELRWATSCPWSSPGSGRRTLGRRRSGSTSTPPPPTSRG